MTKYTYKNPKQNIRFTSQHKHIALPHDQHHLATQHIMACAVKYSRKRHQSYYGIFIAIRSCKSAF